MSSIPSPSPFDSLACALRGMLGLVGAWGKRGILNQALMFLLYRRISETIVKMERLAARFLVGTLPSPRVGAIRRTAPAGERPARAQRVWPGQHGWLCRLVTWEAGQHGALLRHALVQPEMQALLAASPQARRILLPMCRMLAIESSLLRPGGVVKAPKPPAPKRVRTRRPPVDWGRVPLPRGLLKWATRERALERALAEVARIRGGLPS